MKLHNFLYLCVFIALAVTSLGAQKSLAQNVILEHFPTFGCMDTAANEEFFQNLIGKDDDVLVLACYNVPEDIISGLKQDVCSDRRVGYIVHNLLNAGATPLVQLNGQYNINGSFPNVVESGIRMARAEDTIAQIPLRIEQESLIADLPDIQHHKPLELWFIAYNKHIIHYLNSALIDPEDQAATEETDTLNAHNFHNMVTKINLLGDWDGGAERITIPLNNFRADGFVILVQEKNYNAIIGSGWIKPGTHNYAAVTE